MAVTIKTPDEIAHEVYKEINAFPTEPKGSDLRALMVRAIEADRSHHQDVLETLIGESEDI